jgi:hypothetical protein
MAQKELTEVASGLAPDALKSTMLPRLPANAAPPEAELLPVAVGDGDRFDMRLAAECYNCGRVKEGVQN